MSRTRIALTLGAALTALAVVAGTAGCAAQPEAEAAVDETTQKIDLSDVTLKVGVLDTVWARLIEDSGLFDDAPYKIETSVATFPQQVAGLNSGELDLAFYGVSTPVLQAGNEPVPWTADSAPVKLIGGWSPDQEGEYPWFGTAVRTDSGIDSIDDLKGASWAWSTSGDAYPSFLANLKEAGLTHDDISGVSFQTSPEQVAAFTTGQADVFTSGFTLIAPLLASGEAKILVTSRELGVPVLRGYAATAKTLADPVKEAAIADWYVRFDELNSTYWDEHEADIVALYQSEQQLTPEQAEYNWNSLVGTKQRTFDDVLFKGVQQNADLYFADGAIQNKIDDVSVFFDDRFQKLVKTFPQPQP